MSHAQLPRLPAIMNAPHHVQQYGEHKVSAYSEASPEIQKANTTQEVLPQSPVNHGDLQVGRSFDRNDMEPRKSQESNSNPQKTPSAGMLERKGQAQKNSEPSNDIDPSVMTPLQQVIESQFSLEILLKHRELRLVDQEIAKCQTALEQLRRCHVIPYPAISSRYEDMQAVSSGFGPSYTSHIQSPPPWGVTDGPYTRHYQKWLIPDPAFDGSIAESPHPLRTGNKTVPERTTRGSIADKSTVGLKSRTQRGSANARLHALPHGYPESKEEKGPMIIQRSTDGKMVKLVCLDCHRENFNSAQGFINHCRIAHNRGFASHDAAAVACGVETDSTPTTGVGVATESPGVAPMSGTSVGLVHPLNRPGQPTKMTPTAATPRRRTSQSVPAQTSNHPLGLTHNSVSTAAWRSPKHLLGIETPTSGSFTPSSQTPHLSALYAKTGWSGDLDEMVIEAKTKPDVDADAQLMTEDDDQDDIVDTSETAKLPQTLDTPSIARGGRLPARAAMSPAPLERTPSSKGIKNGPRKPGFLNNIIPQPSYSSPYTRTPTAQAISPTDLTSTGLNLSPNTIESHPAPSLVSDDGDYENTHSESEVPSSDENDEDEGRYLEVEVEDHDEEIGLGGSSSANQDLGLGKAQPPTARIARRSSALRAEVPLQDEDLDGDRRSYRGTERRPRRKG